jgi:hypothetical protein
MQKSQKMIAPKNMLKKTVAGDAESVHNETNEAIRLISTSFGSDLFTALFMIKCPHLPVLTYLFSRSQHKMFFDLMFPTSFI